MLIFAADHVPAFLYIICICMDRMPEGHPPESIAAVAAVH
jgi:hypothetical protein